MPADFVLQIILASAALAVTALGALVHRLWEDRKWTCVWMTWDQYMALGKQVKASAPWSYVDQLGPASGVLVWLPVRRRP